MNINLNRLKYLFKPNGCSFVGGRWINYFSGCREKIPSVVSDDDIYSGNTGCSFELNSIIKGEKNVIKEEKRWRSRPWTGSPTVAGESHREFTSLEGPRSERETPKSPRAERYPARWMYEVRNRRLRGTDQRQRPIGLPTGRKKVSLGAGDAFRSNGNFVNVTP